MGKKILLSVIAGFIAGISWSQLVIDNAIFTIEAGATVSVKGNITSNVDIQGNGLLELVDVAAQNIDMSGHIIPNLKIDKSAGNVVLLSDMKIGSNLILTNGKIKTGNFNLFIASSALVTPGAANSFIWTDGTGQLRKELSGGVTNLELPLGENANYRPLFLTISGSTFDPAANFGAKVLGTADPNKPPSTASHLTTSWPVTKNGINGGTVTVSGQYVDPLDVNGTEANIVGYYYNTSTGDWTSTGETHDASTNRVGVPITSDAGALSGINKFLLVGARTFLQGAYVSSTGLMADNGLRTLPFGSSSSTANFPSTDPYRVAPYNSNFSHVSNDVTETIPYSSVLGAQAAADDNIVDWVFLQLRNLNASPGNFVLQTRSALIQRDGDIVDVDGVSPVTFNNILSDNYIITVRHRNHLGISFNQASSKLVTEQKSSAYTPSRVFDLRTALSSQLYGTSGAAYTTLTHPTLGTVNVMWGGDASGNAIVRYQGSNGPTGPNDRLVLLQSLGGVESNVFTGYYRGDLNMNKIMRYQGSNGPTGPNDRLVLLQMIGNVESNVKTQSIPN
ncbi:MAG TPA: hypothetical protein PKC72_02280 [Chitinophagaceae bacterium]|nr:hypothetical protein [Chitinophagaceae bacterium]